MVPTPPNGPSAAARQSQGSRPDIRRYSLIRDRRRFHSFSSVSSRELYAEYALDGQNGRAVDEAEIEHGTVVALVHEGVVDVADNPVLAVVHAEAEIGGVA